MSPLLTPLLVPHSRRFPVSDSGAPPECCGVCTALAAKKTDDPDDHLIATFLKGDGTRFEQHGIVHEHIAHRKRGLRVEWQGVRIRVFWPTEEAWYDGTVRRTARQQDASIFFIAYDDGTSEWRELGETQWTCLSTIVVDTTDADTLISITFP